MCVFVTVCVGQIELNADVPNERTALCACRRDFKGLVLSLLAVNVSPSHSTEYGGHGQQQGQTAVRGPPTRELQTASDRPVSSLCFPAFLRLHQVLVHTSAHKNLKQLMGDNCEG